MFERVLTNTLRLSVYQLIAGFPLPIIFALALNSVQAHRFKKVVQTITYMPHFISTVVLVGIMKRILDINTGIVNNVVENFGGNFHTDLFNGGGNFRWLYICSSIWQNTGWNSIIYMAALSGVSPELHEAATIDGASRWQRVMNIDLPTIVPTIIIMLILSAGGMMDIGFDKAYLMQNDTNLVTSEVISTYVYKVGFQNAGGDLSYSTAIGLFNSVVNLFMVLLVNGISRKITNTGIW